MQRRPVAESSQTKTPEQIGRSQRIDRQRIASLLIEKELDRQRIEILRLEIATLESRVQALNARLEQDPARKSRLGSRR
jgi:hypothetical protein